MDGPSYMALETVGHVVAALVDSYAVALECYAGWRLRQRARNHYHYRTTSNNDGDNENADSTHQSEKGAAFSAAGASLRLSKFKIEEAFNSGVDMLGDEFTCGDGKAMITTPGSFPRYSYTFIVCPD